MAFIKPLHYASSVKYMSARHAQGFRTCFKLFQAYTSSLCFRTLNATFHSHPLQHPLQCRLARRHHTISSSLKLHCRFPQSPSNPIALIVQKVLFHYNIHIYRQHFTTHVRNPVANLACKANHFVGYTGMKIFVDLRFITEKNRYFST